VSDPHRHELAARPLRVPSAQRLAPDAPHFDEILERHDRALLAGDATYLDPATGYVVFTARFLAERGSCCDSRCRHCPYVADP
jgi:hypothetical protein